MTGGGAVAMVLLLCAGARGEVIDRVAVSLDRLAITASAVEEEVRVTAFQNRAPLDLSGSEMRKAADRLVEQALVRREMAISRYTEPADEEVDKLIEAMHGEHPDYEKDLATYGLSEKLLRRHLGEELAVLRFIEIRFRPAVVVSDQEAERYYAEEYLPTWKKNNGDKEPPALDEARDEIEQTLTQSKVDQALDQWLTEVKRQARIRYVEEAFQ